MLVVRRGVRCGWSCDTAHPANQATRCTNVFPNGTVVTLAAQAYNGVELVQNLWGGDAAACGNNATCTLTVNDDLTVTITGVPT